MRKNHVVASEQSDCRNRIDKQEVTNWLNNAITTDTTCPRNDMTKVCHSELVSESKEYISPNDLGEKERGRDMICDILSKAPHPNPPRSRGGKKVAFTLAEVLITLGVIGIVAAMTIPNLMTNYQKKMTAVKIKKSYATLLQAIRLSEEENGELIGWENSSDTSSVDNTRENIKKYLLPYLSGVTECSTGNDHSYKCGYPVSGYGINYLLNNGIAMSVLLHTSSEGMFLHVVFSTPHVKTQIGGRNWFYFDTVNSKHTFLPSGWIDGLTREQILNGYTTDDGHNYACQKTKRVDGDLHYRHGCTALLMMDNLEFAKDYPW